MNNSNKLKFIALSGTTGVTENLYVYEYGNDMLVVDCGVGFPESEMFGVDLVIPDFSYIKQNAAKLRGVLISHGHEDHLGALPFLLKDVKTTIYATKLVGGFIQDKFEDYDTQSPKISIFDPEKDVLKQRVRQRIMPLLTPEQQKKYDQMEAEREERKTKRRKAFTF